MSDRGRRLVVLPATQDSWLVDEIAAAWEAGEAISVVDLSAPSARARLDAIAAHLLRLPSGDVDLWPDAPPLPEDAAIVQTTSGTTGKPRAVVLTHANVAASARAVHERLALTPRDHWTTALSPAFIGGLATIARALVANVPITLLAQHRPQCFERARALGATLATTVAAALERVDVSFLRAVILGAQPARGALPAHAITSYGMTETGSGVVWNGEPLPGVEVRLEHGAILLRGPMIARSWRDGSPVLDPDGWLHTGDVGDLVDGRLTVVGRAQELINTGGHHVAPAVVEAAVSSALSLDPNTIAVYGTYDDRFGEVVTLAVTTSPAPTVADLAAALADHLDAPWLPRRVVRVTHIPRTDTGKPVRHELPGAVVRPRGAPRGRG